MKGAYSGYTYDYLTEAAQYTGWKFDFVQVSGTVDEQVSTLIDMLVAGEIDLLGSMWYLDSLTEVVDYAGYNYGTAYSCLCVLEDNTGITENTVFTLDKIRVAVFNSATQRNGRLDQYAEMNGISLEKVYCDGQVALRENKAAALLTVDRIMTVCTNRRTRPFTVRRMPDGSDLKLYPDDEVTDG